MVPHLFLFLKHVRCVSVSAHYIFRSSVGAFARGLAVVDTRLLSWRASRLLMFLCKHRAALRGREIDPCQFLVQQRATLFSRLCAYSLQITFTPLISPEYTHLLIKHSLSLTLFSSIHVVPLACSQSIYNHRF